MATEGGGDPQSVTQATAPVLEVDSAIRSPEDPKRVILQPAALSVENERPTVGVPEVANFQF